MRVEAHEVSPVLKEVVVELPAERVDAELNLYYRDLARRAKVPGFRPGKVPRSVLEKRFGNDVKVDVAQKLVRESSPEALEQVAVNPIADPIVQQVTVSAGQPFQYTMRVEIWPKIEPVDYFELPAKVPPIVVDDAEVERELHRVQEQRTELRPIEGRTTVEHGDVATLSYVATVDGAPFEGNTQIDRQLEVGSNATIPGFEDAIIGLEVGKTTAIELTLPEAGPDKSIAGKKAKFEVTISDLRQKHVPVLDDDFAKEFAPGLETLDALKEELRKHLQRQAEARVRRDVNEQLIDAALGKLSFEVPGALVEAELSDAIREARMSLVMMGIAPEQLNLDDRRLRADMRPRAERRARQRVLLDAIADKEGLSVADDEVEARITSHAEATGQALSKVRQSFAKGRAKERLRAQMREEKVLDLIRSKARIETAAAEETPSGTGSQTPEPSGEPAQ